MYVRTFIACRVEMILIENGSSDGDIFERESNQKSDAYKYSNHMLWGLITFY